MLSTCWKRSPIITLALLFLCISCSKKEMTPEEILAKQCTDAQQGTLDLTAYDSSDAQRNTYLFTCAIDGISNGITENKIEKKVELANYFLEQPIEVNYLDENQETLLLAVTQSKMPKQWKYSAADTLMMNGVDIGAKNAQGFTAQVIAAHSGDSQLASLIGHFLGDD